MSPRKKATPAVESEIKTTPVAPAESNAKTASAEKKTSAKKTATKSTTTKSATAAKTTTASKAKTTAKKATADKVETAPIAAAPAVPKAEVFIEYGGAQVPVDEIINNAKKIVGDDKDIKIYVQPDTSKAYISFGEESVSMDVFFC